MAAAWMSDVVIDRLSALARNRVGNEAIMDTLNREFGLSITRGMVAGKVHKLCIDRGGVKAKTKAPLMNELCGGALPQWLTPEADDLLQRAAEHKVWQREMATFFGVSQTAVGERFRTMAVRKRRAELEALRGPGIAAPTEAELAFHAGPEWGVSLMLNLCTRWIRGDTGSMIAAALGATRNAVIAKAHRLCDAGLLKGRASPIVHGPRREPAPRRVGKVSGLPALATDAEAPAEKPFRFTMPPVRAHSSVDFRRFDPVRRETPLPRIVRNDGRIMPCQFPTSSGTIANIAGWKFCSEPSEPGRSYCETHCVACYVGWRKFA